MSDKNIDKSKKNKFMSTILKYNKSLGLMIPVDWKSPYHFRKKDFLAIIIGISNRYEFERVFLEKEEFEIDNEERHIGIGYNPHQFKDNMILEEKYSFKEEKTFITKNNFFKIAVLEDSIMGEKISKTQIKELLLKKQESIYERFRDLFQEFGEDFSLFTMKSILKQRKLLSHKNINLFFIDK